MVTPDQIQWLKDAGPYALFVIAIVAFYLGWIRVGRLVEAEANARELAHARELAEIVRDRDEWKSLAQSLAPQVERVGDLLEDLIGAKPAPTRRARV